MISVSQQHPDVLQFCLSDPSGREETLYYRISANRWFGTIRNGIGTVQFSELAVPEEVREPPTMYGGTT